MPDAVEVGSETNVMFGINNTGKVILYNVMARFEADSIQPADAYVGNIKPGETGNVDTMLTAIAPTTDDGKVKIIISYEDENGVVSETEKEMLLNVDVAVIEVGLGGRLDCTNIIHPDLCIITNISFDHIQFLGDTLAKIAGEKALEDELEEELDNELGEPEMTTADVSEDETKDVEKEQNDHLKRKKK